MIDPTLGEFAWFFAIPWIFHTIYPACVYLVRRIAGDLPETDSRTEDSEKENENAD